MARAAVHVGNIYRGRFVVRLHAVMQHGGLFPRPQGCRIGINEVGGSRQGDDVVVHVAPDHVGHSSRAGRGGDGQEGFRAQRVRFCKIGSLQSLHQLVPGHVFHGFSISGNFLHRALRGGAPPVHIKDDQFPQPLDSMVSADNARKHTRPAGKGAGVKQTVGPIGVGAVIFLLIAAVGVHVHQHAAEVVGRFPCTPSAGTSRGRPEAWWGTSCCPGQR